MPHSDFATAIGFAGVALLLLAFVLNLLGRWPANGTAYIALNFIGAALACYSSYLIRFMPFVLLEGTWAIVAGVQLVRLQAIRRG